jgi:mono/diheme cytochrome c family protein
MMPRAGARRLVLTVALVILSISLAACGSRRRGEPFVGPMQISDPSIERGRLAFEQKCYKCHTQGEGGMGPVINDKPLPRFLMRFQVRHGLGTMPAFPPERISDDELEDILNYMVYLRKRSPQ